MLLVSAVLSYALAAAPTAVPPDPGLSILEFPDFSHHGTGDVMLQNLGNTPVPVERIDLVGPLRGGPEGALARPATLGPGEVLRIPLAWDDPTGLAAQLLVRTSSGTVVLPAVRPSGQPALTATAPNSRALVLGTFGPWTAATGPTPPAAGTIEPSNPAAPGLPPPITLGTLDKALIDGVIKKHMGEYRRCYQRELYRDGSLDGKVVLKFVIGNDGGVTYTAVQSTTLAHGSVEACVAERFLRLRFPEPKGGGIVIVKYPFIFSPG